jgi:hypothetical protein
MINLKEYKKLRELLHASNEDFEVACENIKNMKEISPVTKMMFAKSLQFGRRQTFCEKLKIDYYAIKEWNEMFKDLDTILGIVPQDIIEWEVHTQMAPIFKNTWKFIKDVKIELDWNHKKPIDPVSPEEQREINNIVNQKL